MSLQNNVLDLSKTRERDQLTDGHRDNYIGHRAKIGVIIPSTNTAVEYDLQKFMLDGVTWHPSRFWVELSSWQEASDGEGTPINEVFENFLEMIRNEIPLSIRNVMSSEIDHMMLGIEYGWNDTTQRGSNRSWKRPLSSSPGRLR